MKKVKLFRILALATVLCMLAIAIPAVPAFAAGIISLSPVSGAPGATVTISGEGFSASATTVTIQFGTTTAFSEIVETTSVNDGSFETQFEVPYFPRGTYTVTATTNISGDSDTASFTITPAITISNNSGKVGDKILIDGRGFRANSNVNCYFDTNIIDSFDTDYDGTFYDFEVTIPEGTRGNHTIKVADSTGSSPGLTFAISPKITVTGATAAVGGQIGISGDGFAGSSQLSFLLDSITINANVSTNSRGTIPATNLTVPPIAAGTHTLRVTDSSGNFATATVNTRNSLSIAPQSGPIGSTVHIYGKGYLANTRITITYNGAAIATSPDTVMADGNGNFTATIIVPVTAGGTYNIVASDGVNIGTTVFTATSTLTASVNKGSVGTSVPLTGTGFTIGSSVIVKYDDIQIGTATVDSSGAFTASVTVPPSRAGEHKITATDGINSVSVDFSIVPSAKISVTSGNVGTSITASGSAFNPAGAISVKYDATVVATTAADINGSFSTTFQAPASKGGDHTITITDGVTSIVSKFTMESTAPSVPALMAPAKGAKVEPITKFQWQSVTDPSGVTYIFQLSQDAGFNNLILNKTGMTTTFYQLTEQEKLKPAGKDKPYYWRVKAVDGASNESDWSPAQTVVTGFIMPSWGLYLIYIAGALIVFIFGFVVGRKTGSSRL